MLDNLIGTLLKSKWTWIAIAILALGIWVYSLYTENQHLRAEKEALQQNIAANSDILTKMIDSVQTLTAAVSSLQKDAEALNVKYVAVKIKYQLAIDTIRILKRSTGNTVVGDSIGVVSFNGTQGIASYIGRTELNMKSRQSNYSLILSFSPIETQSFLFFDELDKLWKIRTISMTRGVNLRGISTIDDETFRKLQSLQQVQDCGRNTFGIGGMVSSDMVFGGIALKLNDWMLTFDYKLFDNHAPDNEQWYNKTMIGVKYWIW